MRKAIVAARAPSSGPARDLERAPDLVRPRVSGSALRRLCDDVVIAVEELHGAPARCNKRSRASCATVTTRRRSGAAAARARAAARRAGTAHPNEHPEVGREERMTE